MPPKLVNKIPIKKSDKLEDIVPEKLVIENKEPLINNIEEPNTLNSITREDYQPFIIDLPKVDTDIFTHEEESVFSVNIEYPKFSLGFQHYLHANKEKIKPLFDRFKNKKKIYRVMNHFETKIDNYDQSISDYANTYFDIKGDKPKILSRGFYKLWELLFMYDLIKQEDNFVSAHLAEGPGSFIQATMFYRDKFTKNSKNDKYYAVTLHSENLDNHVPELEKDFVKFYEKEKPQRFILHKTYPKQVAGSLSNKDNGDLTDPKTIKLFSKLVGGSDGNVKADFITADGGINWENENTQEQESYMLIFSQIISALKLQKKKGNFVCKFFETYTIPSIKFISVLQQFYEKINIVKPLTSRLSNSEKYVVCLNFKFDPTDSLYLKMIKKLEKIHLSAHSNKILNLIDIFPKYNLPTDLLNYIVFMNIEIANIQFKNVNDIIKFINAQNYYGDVYQMRRDLQIHANKYWISRFFTNIKNNDIKKDVSNLIIKYNESIRQDKIY